MSGARPSLAHASAAAPCPVIAACGGCPLMPSERQRELAAKQAAVSQALEQVGITGAVPEWTSVLARFGYRNRLRLRVTAEGQVAFFNAHKIADCAVLEPPLAALIEQLRDFARRHAGLMRAFAHLEARAPDLDGLGGVCLQPVAGAAPTESGCAALREIGEGVAVTVAGLGAPDAVPRQRFAVADDVYSRVPLDAFLQVNTPVNRALVQSLRDLARERAVQSFADLYAGSGNLGLPLLRDGARGVCVEVRPSALAALQAVCVEQRLAVPELRVEAAEQAARTLHDAGERVDLVIIDAPRAGVKAGIEQMAALSRRWLCVCSCNPVSLARNLSRLTTLGYRLERVLLFDMFPCTQHVEVLAWLERR